jgi:hypothetical protein
VSTARNDINEAVSTPVFSSTLVFAPSCHGSGARPHQLAVERHHPDWEQIVGDDLPVDEVSNLGVSGFPKAFRLLPRSQAVERCVGDSPRDAELPPTHGPEVGAEVLDPPQAGAPARERRGQYREQPVVGMHLVLSGLRRAPAGRGQCKLRQRSFAKHLARED